MDAERFDALARSIDILTPRRVALGIFGGGLAALLANLGSDDAAAKKKKKKCKPCRKKKKGKCKGKKPDGTSCGGENVCQNGQCVSATCDPACEAPEECVDGVCTCPSAQICVDGSCCPEVPECNEAGLCACEGTSICDCPPDEDFCQVGELQQCCLADDTCDPVNACVTDTCVAGNSFCTVGWAFCETTTPCGCFVKAENSNPVCADVSGLTDCPDISECSQDSECGMGEFCVDVSCCEESGTIGLCLPDCPTTRGAPRSGGGRSGAQRKKTLAPWRH